MTSLGLLFDRRPPMRHVPGRRSPTICSRAGKSRKYDNPDDDEDQIPVHQEVVFDEVTREDDAVEPGERTDDIPQEESLY
jgi:hypothetical protein